MSNIRIELEVSILKRAPNCGPLTHYSTTRAGRLRRHGDDLDLDLFAPIGSDPKQNKFNLFFWQVDHEEKAATVVGKTNVHLGFVRIYLEVDVRFGSSANELIEKLKAHDWSEVED